MTVFMDYEISGDMVTPLPATRLDPNRIWTAWYEFDVYKEAGSSEVLFHVAADDVISLTDMTAIDGQVYLKCTNAAGEEGWFPDAAEYLHKEAPETPVTEEEAEPQVEAEPVNEPVEEKEEEIQTTLFKDDEIEKVQVVKKPKGTKPGISVIWTTLRKLSKSVTESAGNLYENVNQGIDNENV
jgi:hypothetical protein